jgi:butyrate kinase
MAYNSWLTDLLGEYISHLGQILVFPGEAELEALARGVLRVLDGIEDERTYS